MVNSSNTLTLCTLGEKQKLGKITPKLFAQMFVLPICPPPRRHRHVKARIDIRCSNYTSMKCLQASQSRPFPVEWL